MTTLVTEKVDILHHAQASLEGKPRVLKRNIQASDGLRSYFSKIADLMHRNLLSWYEDDLVIAKDMIEHPTELENDQGRSGLCACTCSPTVTSFKALNEYENLLSSLSLKKKLPAHHRPATCREVMRMPPPLLKINDGCLPAWEVPPRGACSHRGRH